VPDQTTLSGPPATAALSSFPQPAGATNQDTDGAHLLQFEIDLDVSAALDWYKSRLTGAGYAVAAPPSDVPDIFPARTLDFATPALAGTQGHRGSLLVSATPSQPHHSAVLVVIQ